MIVFKAGDCVEKAVQLVAVGYLQLFDHLLSKLDTNTWEVSQAQYHLTRGNKKCYEIPQDDIRTEMLSLENPLN